MNRYLLFILSTSLLSCATKSPEVIQESTIPGITVEAPAGVASEVPEVAKPADTVETLTQEVDSLQRQLVQLSGPLNPEQEKKVVDIKQKIYTKEMKKASLELSNMLGELKEVEE